MTWTALLAGVSIFHCSIDITPVAYQASIGLNIITEYNQKCIPLATRIFTRYCRIDLVAGSNWFNSVPISVANPGGLSGHVFPIRFGNMYSLVPPRAMKRIILKEKIGVKTSKKRIPEKAGGESYLSPLCRGGKQLEKGVND